ncbi:MAG: DUF563 domain-containing protein [Kiritimatiellales bacterium]
MAVCSTKDKLIGILRGSGWGYRVVRWIYRAAFRARAELIRMLIPRRIFAGLPKGRFSLLEQVCSGGIPGRVIFENQDVRQFGPDSLVKRSGLQQDGFQPWPVFIAQVRNARLFGANLVLLNDRKEACREMMFASHCPATDESYQVPIFETPMFLPGKWTSLVSRWDSGYWHFLMDAVPRLHALSEFSEDTGILLRGPVSAWQYEVLDMLGIRNRVRPTNEKHLMVEELCFSSHTSMTGAWNPFAVQFLRERLLLQTEVVNCPLSVNRDLLTTQRPINSTTSPTKLFLKRGASWTRGIRNQDEVIRFFEERGWTAVEPEKFSVKEQIRMFSQVDAVCGAHGSALTNLLWMKPGAQVIELLADNFMLGAFEWLACCVGLRHHYLVFPGDHRLSFSVDVKQLAKLVDAVL